VPLTIDIYMSEICGSYYELRGNLDQALAKLNVPAEVTYRTITYDDAVSLLISGSPTIRINGKDAFEGGIGPGIA
jgi:hypothetical protein